MLRRRPNYQPNPKEILRYPLQKRNVQPGVYVFAAGIPRIKGLRRKGWQYKSGSPNQQYKDTARHTIHIIDALKNG